MPDTISFEEFTKPSPQTMSFEEFSAPLHASQSPSAPGVDAITQRMREYDQLQADLQKRGYQFKEGSPFESATPPQPNAPPSGATVSGTSGGWGLPEPTAEEKTAQRRLTLAKTLPKEQIAKLIAAESVPSGVAAYQTGGGFYPDNYVRGVERMMLKTMDAFAWPAAVFSAIMRGAGVENKTLQGGSFGEMTAAYDVADPANTPGKRLTQTLTNIAAIPIEYAALSGPTGALIPVGKAFEFGMNLATKQGAPKLLAMAPGLVAAEAASQAPGAISGETSLAKAAETAAASPITMTKEVGKSLVDVSEKIKLAVEKGYASWDDVASIAEGGEAMWALGGLYAVGHAISRGSKGAPAEKAEIKRTMRDAVFKLPNAGKFELSDFVIDGKITPIGAAKLVEIAPDLAAKISAKDIPSRADVEQLVPKSDRITAEDRQAIAATVREAVQQSASFPSAGAGGNTQPSAPVSAEAKPPTRETNRGQEQVAETGPLPDVVGKPPVAAKEPWQMTRGEFDNEAIYQGVRAGNIKGEQGASGWYTRKIGEASSYGGREGQGGEVRLSYASDVPESFTDASGEPVPRQQYFKQQSQLSTIRRDVPVRATIPIGTKDPHRYVVERAIAEGKPVPPEVLAEYPDLKPKEINRGQEQITPPGSISDVVGKPAEAGPEVQAQVGAEVGGGEGQKGAEEAQVLTRSRLANPATSPEARAFVNAVDANNPAPERRPDAVVAQEASARLQNYDAERAKVLEGDSISDVDVKVGKEIVETEGRAAMRSDADFETIDRAARVIEAYRAGGTEQARTLRQRFDPNEPPPKRAARQITESLLELPPKAQGRVAKMRAVSDKLKSDAINEIRKAGGTVYSGIDPTLLKSYAKYGAGLIIDGVASIAEFTSRMRAKFGEDVAADAAKIFEAAGKIARAEGGKRNLREVFEAHANEVNKIKARLLAKGIDLENLDAIVGDQVAVGKVLREISTARKSVWDKVHEYWLSGILSGPPTQIVNNIGNALYGGYHFTAGKFGEALVNKLVRSPDAAQLGELKYQFQGILPALSEALRNSIKSYVAERPMFESQYGEPTSKFEGRGPAISGFKGRVIRGIGTTPMMAADDFAMTLFSNMEAGGRAYRIAKAEGLSGPEMSARIESLVKDRSSDAWQQAVEKARELTWKDKPGPIGQALLKVRRDAPALRYGPLTFITTPAAIFRAALKFSPLGTANTIRHVKNAVNTGDWSKVPESVVQSLVGWSVVLAMTQNNPEDPWITGSGEINRGARDMQYRSVHPAHSVKIGNKWVDYGRWEPFGTALAMGVDFANSLMSGDPKSTMKLPAQFVQQLRDKTFLSGLADLFEVVDSQSPQEGVAKWASSFAASWVPNLVRSTSRAADENIPERGVWGRGKDWLDRLGRRTIAKTELGIIKEQMKYDIWGRPAKRGVSPFGPRTDAVYRMLSPTQVKENEPFIGDLVLKRYNMRHEDQYYPEAPSQLYKGKSGKQQYMTDEQYAQYAQTSGQAAAILASQAKLDAENPNADDVKVIKQFIGTTRTEAKKALLETWDKGAAPPTPEDIAAKIDAKFVRTDLKTISSQPANPGRRETYDEFMARMQRHQQDVARANSRLNRLSPDSIMEIGLKTGYSRQWLEQFTGQRKAG